MEQPVSYEFASIHCPSLMNELSVLLETDFDGGFTRTRIRFPGKKFSSHQAGFPAFHSIRGQGYILDDILVPDFGRPFGCHHYRDERQKHNENSNAHLAFKPEQAANQIEVTGFHIISPLCQGLQIFEENNSVTYIFQRFHVFERKRLEVQKRHSRIQILNR